MPGGRWSCRSKTPDAARKGGTNAAIKITTIPRLAGIIGTTFSISAASAAKIISGQSLTMISGNNSAPYLTSVNGRPARYQQPGFFRTANNEEFAGTAAALFAINQLRIKKAALINDGDVYTTGLANGFKAAFTKLGGKIVLDATTDKGDRNMQPLLKAVAMAKAQLLFFPLFQAEAIAILNDLEAFPDLKPLIRMSAGVLIQEAFIRSAGNKAIGMYFVGPSRPENSVSRRLQENYLQLFRRPPKTWYYLYAYDAANLLFAAIEQTARKNPDGSFQVRRGMLRNALLGMKNSTGATGRLSCNQYGDCASPRFNILRLDAPGKGVDGLLRNVLHRYGGKDFLSQQQTNKTELSPYKPAASASVH